MAHEFYDWLRYEIRRQHARLKLTVKTLTSLQVLLSLLTPLARFLHVSTFKGFRLGYIVSIAYALQFFIILVLFFVTVELKPHVNPERDKQASDATDQFHKYWGTLWMAWLFFYLVLSLQSLSVAIGVNQPIWLWEPLLNSLNNLQTAFVLFCYFVLAEPSLGQKKVWAVALPLWVTFIIYALFDVVFVVVAQGFPHIAGVGNMLFRLLSGLGMGVALALMVGRFESKYIDAPWSVLATLYLYALIQILYVQFRSDQYRYVQEIVTAFALPLRIFLFAFVTWLLLKGKMFFYLGRVREAYESADREWQEFKSKEFEVAHPIIDTSDRSLRAPEYALFLGGTLRFILITITWIGVWYFIGHS